MNANEQPTKPTTWTVQSACWTFAFTAVLALFTAAWGLAPWKYTLACMAFGAAWFSMILLFERTRNKVFHYAGIGLFILGHQVANEFFLQSTHAWFPIKLQGVAVIGLTMSALMVLLWPWFYRFTRLEVARV
jgi:hypothetical protein